MMDVSSEFSYDKENTYSEHLAAQWCSNTVDSRPGFESGGYFYACMKTQADMGRTRTVQRYAL